MTDSERSKDQLIRELRADLAKRQHQEYLDAVLMHLPVGVAILEGEDFRYFRVNRVLADLNGLPVEDHLGKTVAEVIPESAEIVSNLRRVRSEGRASPQREFTIRLPKNPDRDVHLMDFHFPIEVDGEVKAIGAVVLDITARKQSEDQLRKAHDELERRVAERTAVLEGVNEALRDREQRLRSITTELKATQAQLIQAGKLAAVGELSAGIAHELNQPLAALQIFTETMRSEPGRRIGDFSQELNLIAEQHRRMAKIVDNIRGFARQSRFTVETISPAGPLDDALMLVSERLRLAGVEVVREVAESLPSIRADRAALQQVFLNLLSNALQALETMPDEAPKGIRLCLSSSPFGGDEGVEYAVEDTGPGIPEELVARIFDPFFTTKEAGEGTGLGLSLAYGIIAEHSGEIRYQPGAEGGARFVIRVPAATGPRQAGSRQPELETPAETEGPETAGRVLIVDDEEILRVAFGGLFKRSGWDAATAGSGAEALEMLAESRFDVLLVDLRMPEMNGQEVCRRVREKWPEMPVFVVSGYVTKEDEELLVEHLGVVEVFRKPVEMSELMESIRRTLEKNTEV